jgi:hypothetical protein
MPKKLILKSLRKNRGLLLLFVSEFDWEKILVYSIFARKYKNSG